jgi:hypothetical protein
MRNIRRRLGVELVLVAALIAPEAKSASQAVSREQSLGETGTILVDRNQSSGQFLHVPLMIHVHSVERQLNLAVTVESLSLASFNDLPAGEYLIQISASGFQTAQESVRVTGGQIVTITVDMAAGEPRFLLRLTSTASAQPSNHPRTIAPTHDDTNAAMGEASTACSLQDVVHNTSKRLEEFVGNVNRISAVEVLEHERLDKHGKVLEREKHRSNYVAIIEETLPGALNVDEYRDGALGANGSFPHDIATVGMPSLALIFHPSHLDEFKIECEGTAVWREQPVWRLRFQQRKDRPATISAFRVGTKIFPVLIQGTAWVDAENYQIVHLETELLEPIPSVGLYNERQVLDYGPVQFQNSKMSLWLPQEAEIYLQSAGRHFHHRHSYSDYRIFSVEVGQKIGTPK